VAGNVLVLNAGSSTLKASIVAPSAPGAPPAAASAATTIGLGDDASGSRDHAAAVDRALAELRRQGGDPAAVVAVAHRVVHGGTTFTRPTVVDGDVLTGIESLEPFAPLHQAVAVATIRAAMDRLTAIPHVGVFDTAFHATLDEPAWRYPVPRAWDEWGIRRFGFHGLSVEWSVERTASLLGRPAAELGLLVAHLGNGCSVTAVAGGRSVATSRGMTPLEGLMMGTRSGSIDPGVILALLRDERTTVDELAEALDHRSGLLAVSGSTADMRRLETAAAAGDGAASLAIEMFVERVAAAIAAASTTLRELDAVVFTGGIGSGSSAVRTAVAGRLGVLGVRALDDRRLGDRGGSAEDAIVGDPSARPAVLRIEAREDLVAARAALDAISRPVG
jgi:acetate kinase